MCMYPRFLDFWELQFTACVEGLLEPRHQCDCASSASGLGLLVHWLQPRQHAVGLA